MELRSIAHVCTGASANGLQVAWLSTHSRVHAVECRRGGAAPLVVSPEPGRMMVKVPGHFAEGDRVEITAEYSGAPLQLLTGDPASTVPASTLAHFDERRRDVASTGGSLFSHRQLFLILDQETHSDLKSLWSCEPEHVERRRNTIERMTKWLWGNALRRAAAWARDLDPRQPRWDGFHLDVVLLSDLLLSILGTNTSFISEAFERFANGELVFRKYPEQGGPDGAYHVLFGAFAMLAASTDGVPEAQRQQWRDLLPCLVGTLEILSAGYRAPSGQRQGRRSDFAVTNFKDFNKPPFTERDKELLRGRYLKQKEPELRAAFDRWVANMFSEEIADLGG